MLQIEQITKGELTEIVHYAVAEAVKKLTPYTPPTEVAPNLLNIDEASTLLQLKKGYCYELAFKGKIPCYRVGRSLRFSKTELEQWIKAGRPDVMQMGYDAMTANHIVNPKNK